MRWLLLNMRIYIKPTGTGHTSLRQATHYIGCSQSMRWLLLNNTWGLTLRSGLVCANQQRELLPSQLPNTDNRQPESRPHHGFYRLLSLTDDWLICLSCVHTLCCHPVVGIILFALRSLRLHVQTCVHSRNRPAHPSLT